MLAVLRRLPAVLRGRPFVTARQFQRLERIKANRKEQAAQQQHSLALEMQAASDSLLQGRFCEGCGVQLQAKDNSRYGFVAPQHLARSLEGADLPAPICMRCHCLKYYNKLPDEFNRLREDEIKAIADPEERQVQALLLRFKARRCLVVVVDAFDISGTFPLRLVQHAVENREEVLFLLHKFDLLNKKYVNLTAVKQQLARKAEAAGLCSKVVVASSKTKAGLKHLKDQLLEHRRTSGTSHYYFVGVTNVGKSSILNALCNERARPRESEGLLTVEEWDEAAIRLVRPEAPEAAVRLTESSVPRTTLDIVRLRHEELKGWLYDTPGLVKASQFFYQFREPNLMRTLCARKVVAPRSIWLSCDSCLFVGAFARVQCEQAEAIFVFLSEHISLQVCSRQHCNEFYLKQHGAALKPTLDPEPTPRPYRSHRLQLEGDTDLEVEGLGFLSFCGSKARRQVTLDLPEGVGCSLRPTVMRPDVGLVPSRSVYVPKTRLIRQLHS